MLDIFELLKQLGFFVSYISNAGSFPKPLKPDEEKLYLQRYFEGDDEARNILIERNLRLVAHIAKKYASPAMDNEDLISIGTIGLIKAVSTFNSKKSTQLATYASKCIENEILMTIRSGKKLKSEVSLSDPIGIDREGNAISLMDILGTPVDSIADEVELSMQIRKLYSLIGKVLQKRERLVIEMRYGLFDNKGKTQREIAALLGISRSYVSRIEKKAIEKLYAALKKSSLQ